MKLQKVHYENILEHVGYAGGRSRARKNTNYKEVGKKIMNMGHTPPFEHYNVTFDLDGTSRFILYLLSTSRVITLTANSQRYLEVQDVLDSYKQDYFVSNCLMSYKTAREHNVKKEEARSLLPLASKTADISFTTNIRELNRLTTFLLKQEVQECTELASNLQHYLKKNDVLFTENLPAGYSPSLSFPENTKPTVGKLRVTYLQHTGFLTQFVLEIPFYVWMQLIRHKSLSFTDATLLNSFEPLVFNYLDCLDSQDKQNPYHILNGQYVRVLAGGPSHAWLNFIRWRSEKATQSTTRELTKEISKYF